MIGVFRWPNSVNHFNQIIHLLPGDTLHSYALSSLLSPALRSDEALQSRNHVVAAVFGSLSEGEIISFSDF